MENNKPDHKIEEFWLHFKVSMINFYKNSTIKRPIKLWSEQLNEFQKEEKYIGIENNIRNYISLYAIDLMRNLDSYHMNILVTNIKRWNRISTDYGFKKSDDYHNIIFLLVDIYKNLMTETDKNIDTIFSQVELFIIYKDFQPLIKYAIDNRKPSILEKINKFKNINDKIEQLYNIKKLKNMSYLKLIDKINLNN